MTTDKKQLWKRFCKYLQTSPDLGISVDISRIRFPDDFFDSMSEKMQLAFSQMEALEAGAIANPDENRMVGHYWLRTSELAPDNKIQNQITENLIHIQQFVTKIHSGSICSEQGKKFQNVLLVGIGGSALGPQLLADALSDSKQRMQLYFCDNTDPDGIARILTTLEGKLSETLVLVVSKSGGTIETRNGQLEIAHAYSQANLTFAKHAVAITSVGSKLDALASTQNWLDTFEMWDWVGGRTSIFSAVGLLPAALQGIDVERFLEGARTMDGLTRIHNAQENPAALLALMWFFTGEGTGKKDMVVLPYRDRLLLFSKYLQQLVMESLGKEIDCSGNIVHQGIAVYGNKGSTDQHAYVQQLREGLNNFFVTFVEVQQDYVPWAEHCSHLVLEDRLQSGDYLAGFLLGTRDALFENGRDSITITLEELTEKSLGALIALYERAVGLYASLIHINAYHQPGVEAGKKAAERVITLQQMAIQELENHSEGMTAEALALKISSLEDAETIYHILDHLAANQKRGLQKTSGKSPQEAQFCLLSS